MVNCLKKQHQVLEYLTHLPRKIINLHGIDNMTELVLHNLCHENCFNLKKAAFFVDNRDFHCIKGVAGFSRDENKVLAACDAIWEHPERFSQRMKELPFNTKVRSFLSSNTNKSASSNESFVREIATDLSMSDPLFVSMPMKYDNHGIFVFEKNDKSDISTEA